MANHILAVCLDFGDTLSDQGTESRDADGTLVGVGLIEGARELIGELRKRGYRLALVADGNMRDARNALAQHGLDRLFDAIVISEAVGASKPDPRMFRRALDELGIEAGDYGRTVMVGNRLERDVKGARELGMTAVWIDWSPRYAKQPEEAAAVPDHRIDHPLELLALLDRIEAEGG
jgi:FMN phosphatase YigB (HAD superfamily)